MKGYSSLTKTVNSAFVNRSNIPSNYMEFQKRHDINFVEYNKRTCKIIFNPSVLHKKNSIVHREKSFFLFCRNLWNRY